MYHELTVNDQFHRTVDGSGVIGDETDVASTVHKPNPGEFDDGRVVGRLDAPFAMGADGETILQPPEPKGRISLGHGAHESRSRALFYLDDVREKVVVDHGGHCAEKSALRNVNITISARG